MIVLLLNFLFVDLFPSHFILLSIVILLLIHKLQVSFKLVSFNLVKRPEL